MAVSTKATAKELEKFLSNPGAEILRAWMVEMQASLVAVASQVDTDRESGTDAVDAITVEE
jgi:hypothetical protein